MSRATRIRLYLLATVLLTVGLVWLAASLQHGVASTRGERLLAADQLLIATLDEEVELLAADHGDGSHRIRTALEARARYEDALADVESETEGVPKVLAAVEGFTRLRDRWESLADEAGAAQVAEKLRVAISRIDVPGVERAITGSFGVAAYPSHAIDAPTLLRKADRALYLAKERGRDRVELAAAQQTANA